MPSDARVLTKHFNNRNGVCTRPLKMTHVLKLFQIDVSACGDRPLCDRLIASGWPKIVTDRTRHIPLYSPQKRLR